MLPNVVPYSIAAIGTLLTYDVLCTLDEEVAYVWSAPRSIGKYLFFMNRYLPFIDTFISLDLLTGSHSPEICLTRFKVITWMILIGILLAEVILMIRTYAIWERRRSVLITLSIVAAVVFIPCIVITQLEAASLLYIPAGGDCSLGRASTIIFIAYLLLLLSETTIFILTMIKFIRHFRHSAHGSSWILKLYTDGLLFYFYLLMITLANVIVPVAGPPALANWLATPQRVMHSILCSRVLLFILRRRNGEAGLSENGGPSDTIGPISEICFDNMARPSTSTPGVGAMAMDEVPTENEDFRNV